MMLVLYVFFLKYGCLAHTPSIFHGVTLFHPTDFVTLISVSFGDGVSLDFDKDSETEENKEK